MRERNLRFIVFTGIICLLVVAMPASSVKTAEQPVGDPVTRGSRFTVTITGLPNSSYYLWIPHTSTMTGQPYDQPPFIAGSQQNVMEDPADGPWPVGSYQYNNGNGDTIRDDIAPSTPDMPNTRYYALVTTDEDGQASVEFHTSVYTGLRSYSVTVENPRSAGSDNLLVEIQVYSRKAPVVMQIDTTPEPHTSTLIPVVVHSLPSETVPTVTTTPVFLQTPVPGPIPTQKSPLAAVPEVLAAGAVFLVLSRH